MDKSLPNRAVEWRDDQLFLLDQRVLPDRVDFLHIDSMESAHAAIKSMVVRGAPAIGVAAAYAVVLSANDHATLGKAEVINAIEKDIEFLATARPTAVNLQWALNRMLHCMHNNSENLLTTLVGEATKIHQEDIAANQLMGEFGASYIDKNSHVMTHCNAGALATGGYGTALGVIRSAYSQGKIVSVFANETRPWFQGSRLTAWELNQEGIPVQLICDSAAASAMQLNHIEWVIVGADRVAANGDVANKIGTFGLAMMAKHLNKKFMVVAPTSTIDLICPNGEEIKIEQRAAEEITKVAGKSMASEGVSAWNPVFDVTPAELVDVLVTERGVIENPSTNKIAQLFGTTPNK